MTHRPPGPERPRLLARRAVPLRRATGTRRRRSSCATRSRADGTLGERAGVLRHDRRAGRGGAGRDEGRARATSTSPVRAASGSSPPRGSTSARLRAPELPANMAWGDADGRTLYLHRAHRPLPRCGSGSRASVRCHWPARHEPERRQSGWDSGRRTTPACWITRRRSICSRSSPRTSSGCGTEAGAGRWRRWSGCGALRPIRACTACR